jgi:hypothetical protein
MLSFFTANTIIETVCFAFAVICLVNDNDSTWKSQILYLFITCVAEFSGIYVSRHTHNNQWVYNLFILAEAFFTYLMFYKLFKKYKQGNYLIIGGLALFILFYSFGIEKNGFLTYVGHTYIVISVQFVLYSLYYYYLLIKDDRYIDLRFSPEFWWVAGTLFFYFANTTCNLFDDELYTVIFTPFHQHLTYFIFKALNIILYSCWSYSFICKRWLSKTLQS